MGIISWILLGGIAGWIASMLVNKTGEGLVLDIVLGIIGAMIGGWVFTALGATGVTELNLWSLLVAVLLLKGYIFSGYKFGTGEFKTAIYLIVASLIALLGAWFQFRHTPRPRKY